MKQSLLLMALMLLAGCYTTPDRIQDPLFNPDYESHLSSMTSDEQASTPLPEPLQLPGEGPIDLSIVQAVMLMLHHHRDLRVQQLSPVIADSFEAIERGIYDPQLFARLQYNEEEANETTRATGDQFAVESNDITVEAGLRQRLPTGTVIEGGLTQERSTSNRAPEQQVARLGLSVTQALLRGHGAAANMVSVEQARLGAIASLYELRGFTESLVAETEIAYWNYILAVEEIRIFESSLDVARRQLVDIEERIELGALARTDAATAQGELARREQALIDARSQLTASRLRLLRLIAPRPAIASNQPLRAITRPQVQAEPIDDAAERVELARLQRPDLNEARLRLRQNRLEVIVTRDGILPRLDLFIDLGVTGFDNRLGGTYERMQDGTYDVTIGLEFTHYLNNRAANARDRAARASVQQASHAIANLEQRIELDVLLALDEVERARQQIAATRMTREFAELTLTGEGERFAAGATTALQVAFAQRDLLTARIAEVEAIITYRIARVNLYLAEGSLLERRGIRVPETIR